jgi:transcriptional regulator with XRE-family HTH domain
MPVDVRAVRLRVGGHVQRLRRSRGLSQEQLAELVGNTGKHIGQVERGEVNVGLDILARIAHALSVDPSDLLAGHPRRRRAESPLFLVTRRELDQIEQVVRSVRAARVKSSDSGPD